MLATKSSRIIARAAIRKTSPVLSTTAQQQQTRSYHENIVEHYENPRNVGSLDKSDKNVGTVCIVSYFGCLFCFPCGLKEHSAVKCILLATKDSIFRGIVQIL